MKKIACISIILVILTCSACAHQTHIQSDAAPAPPKSIVFESCDEFNQFLVIGETKDETKVYEFLEKESYTMNGIYSKQDVVNVSETLLQQRIPWFDGYQVSWFQYYPERNSIYVRYNNADSSITYSRELSEERATEIYSKNIEPHLDELIYEDLQNNFQVYSIDVDNAKYHPFLVMFENSYGGVIKMFCEEEEIYNIISNKLTINESESIITQKNCWFESE